MCACDFYSLYKKQTVALVMMAKTMQPVDAVIVGAGPVGSYTALRLAKLGVKAHVYEEHPSVGLPSHCAGHISIRSLKALGYYPLPSGIVENTFNAANFYSPSGTKFSLKLKVPVTVALNRAKFDQYIAQQAEAADLTVKSKSAFPTSRVATRFCRFTRAACHWLKMLTLKNSAI